MKLPQAVDTEEFKTLSKVAEDIGTTAYVVGGYVRDFLVRNQSKKDIDIVTEGDGIALSSAFAKALSSDLKVAIFKNYGTAAFHYNGVDWEFVGARKESYKKDSRNPLVEKGSLKDDQNRRDFTINAMAISLQKENWGELIDPFNGMQDLENRLIRTPLDPDITFSDDPLRMMRAIRFASQLQFSIVPETLEGIKKNAHRISIISHERISTELNKIILSEKPSIGFYLLDETGLLELILPELTALKGTECKDGLSHKDNFSHTLEVVDNISENTHKLYLRWAALLHDIGKAPTKKFIEGQGWTFHSHEFVGSKMVKPIFERLRLPMGKERKYVEKMVYLSSRPIPLVDKNVSDSALRRLLFDAGDELEDLFILSKADITTKNVKKQERFKQNFEKVEEKLKNVEEKDKIRNFQPPISGEDIMNTFDMHPGREIGIIKDSIKEAILEGKIKNDYKSAYKYMLELGKDLNLKTSSK